MSQACTFCGKTPAPYLLPSRLPHSKYACDEHAPFKVGDRVRILARSLESVLPPFGIITQAVPEKDGYLVQPEGYRASFGWTVYELELAPLRVTRFERQEPI